jgi:hypothetical protein
MKTILIALVMLVLAGSAANAFSEYFDLSGQRVIRQKSISAYNALPTDDVRDARRNRPPAAIKPYTAREKSLFQRLLRWE